MRFQSFFGKPWIESIQIGLQAHLMQQQTYHMERFMAGKQEPLMAGYA
jgi:hypothetical protein